MPMFSHIQAVRPIWPSMWLYATQATLCWDKTCRMETFDPRMESQCDEYVLQNNRLSRE